MTIYSHCHQPTSDMSKSELKEFIIDFKMRISVAKMAIADDDQLRAAGTDSAISTYALEHSDREVRINDISTVSLMQSTIETLERRLASAYGTQNERLGDLCRTARRLIKDMKKRIAARAEADMTI